MNEGRGRPVANTAGRRPGLLVTAVATTIIGVLTLTPGEDTRQAASCLLCPGGVRDALGDALRNVLLFLPFGAGLHLAGARPRVVALAALVLSLAVEGLQLGVVAGRDATPRDVAANVAGALLATLLATLLPARLYGRPQVGSGPGAVVAGAIPWCAATLFGAWAMAPLHEAGPAYVLWAHRWAHLRTFTGTVLAVSVDGRPAPDTRTLGSATPLHSLGATVTLDVVSAARAAPGFAPIASVSSARRGPTVHLGQDGDRVVARVRTRAARLGLRAVTVTLDSAFAVADADRGAPLRVRLVVSPRSVVLATTAPAVASRTVSLTALHAWSLLPGAERLADARLPWDAAWAALLLIPLGATIALARRRTAAAALAAAFAVTGLAGFPLAFGTALPGAPEWGGALLGLALGGAAGGAVRAGYTTMVSVPSTESR